MVRIKNLSAILEISIAAYAAKGFIQSSVSSGAVAGGDRVNAELQHLNAITEMRLVGIPASAGLSANLKRRPRK